MNNVNPSAKRYKVIIPLFGKEGLGLRLVEGDFLP
jgi:hypothetical protein